MPARPNPPAAKLLELASRSIASADFPQAESHLRNVLLHDPANPTALHLLGLRTFLNGNPTDARHLLARAVDAAPDDIPILTSFATMLHELGEPQPALDTFLRILALDNTSPDIWNAAGICLQETGQPALAVDLYLRALNLRPTFAEAHSNLAAVLIHEGDTHGAIDHLLQARNLNPALPDVHHNLGTAQRNRFEYAASIASFREALRLKPNSPDILGSLGEVLSLIDSPEAEPLLRRSVELLPHDPEKHWNLALHLLKTGNKPGNLAEGFREYDWRWQRPQNQKPLRPLPQPFWRGEPHLPLANTTLLITAEQGFGDTLQFLRYIPLVLAQSAARRARIILEVQPALKRLVTQFAHQLAPNITVLGEGESLPTFDLHTAFMTLPLALATTLETIPPPIRLTPPAPPRPAIGPLRIGIAWSGNPRHDRDRERSIPTEALAPLFALPNCTWVSLQVGTHAPQPTGIPLEQPPLRDFLDTANLIDTLDLVLSVDTAVAHLAATQGIPTWILLPFVADWRWLSPATETNPWYPHARLFRQKTLPDGRPQTDLWQPLIAEVAQALEALTISRA
jgi:Flp pilus assembly protein TadD